MPSKPKAKPTTKPAKTFHTRTEEEEKLDDERVRRNIRSSVHASENAKRGDRRDFMWREGCSD